MKMVLFMSLSFIAGRVLGQIDAEAVEKGGIYLFMSMLATAVVALWRDNNKTRKEMFERLERHADKSDSVIEKNTESISHHSHVIQMLEQAIKQLTKK